MEDKLRLGKMLVESKMLTEEQLKMAMDFQTSVGGKLGAIVVKLGFIEDHTLTAFIARQQGMPVVNLDEIVLPENLVKKLPKKLIEHHHVLPIRYHDGVLTVVTSDPYDYEAIEEIQLSVDCRVEVQLAARSQILRSISEVFARMEAGGTVKEKSREQILKDLDHSPVKMPKEKLLEALIPLLVAKGVITEDELARKAREL
jgi:type IV pilus assembly protein PilB